MKREYFRLDGDTLSLPAPPNTVGRIIEAAVYFFLALVFAVLACSLLNLVFEGYVYTLAMLAALILAVWLIVRFSHREKRVLLVLLILSAALRAVVIMLVPTQPVSDFSQLFEAAQATAVGDLSWSHVTQDYFSWWQYQIPFVLYEALVYKLVPSMAVLKLLNLVWSIGVNYFLYRLAARFLPKRCALIAAFLYAVHPGQIALVPVLTNQHISMFFMLFGLTVLFEAKSWKGFALSGALLAVGNLMRPEAVILVAALGCLCLCSFIQQPGKKRLMQLLAALAAVGLAYFAVQKAAEWILYALDIAPYGLGNSVPEWKLVVGLNTQTGGSLTMADVGALYITDPAERHEECMAIVKGYIDGCANLPAFFFGKFIDFWRTGEDFSFALGGINAWETTRLGLTYERLFAMLGGIETAERFFAYGLTAAGCVMLGLGAAKRRSRRAAGLPLIIAAILCGIVLVYLIIEIQPRYRYIAMPFIFIMASVPFAANIKNGK